MSTLTVKTVEDIDKGAVLSAMKTMGIDAHLELETQGSQYDFAELSDDDGQVVWSTDGVGSQTSRSFFDEVWS